MSKKKSLTPEQTQPLIGRVMNDPTRSASVLADLRAEHGEAFNVAVKHYFEEIAAFGKFGAWTIRGATQALEHFGPVAAPAIWSAVARGSAEDVERAASQLVASGAPAEEVRATMTACLTHDEETAARHLPTLATLGVPPQRLWAVIRSGLVNGKRLAEFLPLALRYGDETLRAEADAAASADFIDAQALPRLTAAGMSNSAVRRVVASGLTHEATDRAAGFLPWAVGGDEGLHELVWSLLSDLRKTMRNAAADALGGSTLPVVDRAAGLLTAETAVVREAASRLLGRRGDAAASAVLLNRLPNEPAVSVRAGIVSGLLDAGVPLDAIADASGPADLDDFTDRGRKVKKLAWKWLAQETLPPLKTTDGRTVDAAAVRLILYAQSKQTRPMPDPEVLPLYRLVDRNTSGTFALALLAAMQQSGRMKANAWAMIPAGLLGDGRAVAALIAAVRRHAQKYDEKLFTHAIHALALNGTDAALSAVAGVADQHRDAGTLKHRKAAAVADAALDRLAAGRGITRAELDEQIIPTFGFPADGSARRIEAGKRVIEARVDADFKLSLTDAATGKRAASIPKAAGEAVAVEFKGLRKLLGETAKQQARRLERLMIDGHRWDGAAWSRRFLGHPLLLPFAQRLAWAIHDDDRPTRLFRALADRTLTDADDEAVEPPAAGEQVGVVHPLSLDAETLEAWRGHLADYEVQPPFEQLDRPTARTAEDSRDSREYAALKGIEVGGLSLRSRLLRLGWAEEYGVYRRRFAGATARLTVDGAGDYHGRSDPSATVKLGPLAFFTSAERDAPPLPLGEVRPLVYSEAVGHLNRLAGLA